MNRTTKLNVCGLLFTLLVVAPFSSRELAAQVKRSNALELSFKKSELSVDHSLVSVADVANISGGTRKLRILAGRLDLEELQNLQAAKITQQQLAVRLLVEGFKQEDFSVTGEPSTSVKFIQQDDLAQRIEAKIESELARQFGIGLADVQVNLSSKTNLDQISKEIDVQKFDLMAIFPNKLPVGDKTIQVELFNDKGQRYTTRLTCQIVVMKEMVVTSSIIPRGTVITADHVQTVKRPMANDDNVELATLDCIGCTAVRDIPPYEIVSTRYVTKQSQSKKEIVVKQNSPVDILLVRGRMNIRMRNAKALRSGAVGEMIPVLNTNSNKKINAVVKDQSTVVIKY